MDCFSIKHLSPYSSVATFSDFDCLIVYFRKHTYSLLELHISITEGEQITNTQLIKKQRKTNGE